MHITAQSMQFIMHIVTDRLLLGAHRCDATLQLEHSPAASKSEDKHSVPPESFLIIGQLYDERHLKSFLQILSEHEWDEMPQMECF